MIEKLIAYCARNKFFVFLGVLFFTAWGIWAIYNISLDAIPDLSDVQVIVFTEWPGRSPDLVEDQITYPIITSMIAAPRVQLVRGISDFGFSYVYIIFEEGTDIYWARSRVLEYLQKIIGNLPEGVTPVLGPDATAVGWVFEYALVDETGQHNLQELRSFQDWHLRYWLESVPGVAEVASVGGFVKQYQVELDPNKLLAYRIPLSRVIDSIRRSNNDVGGRVVEFATTEYMVRGRGYIQSVKDIEMIPVGTDGKGTPIYIRDIGYVHLGPDMRRGLAELDGKGEVVGGIVVMRYGQNALDVINGVKRKLKEIEGSLPPGVKVVTTYDRSDLILRAIETLKGKLTEEMVVVALVIILFLLHVRTALIPIIALPIAVIISFIPMYYMKLTANIMSLGGIAIAIGAMVDASIVMTENAHKKLEEWEEKGRPGSRSEVLISSFQEVGKTIFFALLVITISFLPVFALQAQEGRLFKPLAYTKTFSMFFAAILAVTLVPPLGLLFIRGKIWAEEKHPISRVLFMLYTPVLNFVLRFRKTVILLAIIAVLSTVPVFLKLGSEFMPPLNEGSLLFMPTAVPGMSITEAARVLQVQDKILRQVPEVVSVFGKIGRARTSTDPAPLSMVETTIVLKPQEEWRKVPEERWHSSWAPERLKKILHRYWPEERPMTWDELVKEMNEKTRTPGMSPVWWMPVQTRTEMLTTGIRSNLGIKVFGPKLETIEKIAIEIERVLQEVPGTRSAFAERITGGYYLDFKVNREEAARYGLTAGDVEDIIESAIGGKNISQTIEGRERYPINVRYFRQFRDDLEALGRVLVPAPTGAQVPISLLADMRFLTGPPMIRDEDGQLVGYVFVDVAHKDYEGYVEQAQKTVSEKVKLPPGYRLEWAGQYQYLLRMKERLKLMIPLTIFIIFVLLYMNFKSWKHVLVIFLAVPFSLVGAIWLLYLLDYNLSIAVWVGIIALAGLDAETGAVMLLYLELAYQKWKKEGRLRSFEDLKEAIHYGAVKRVRPKMMTVMTTIVGLLPIMWADPWETGADVAKRMAAPMVGGLITSFILELTIYPAIYAVWRRIELEGIKPVLMDMIPLYNFFKRRREKAAKPELEGGAPEAEAGKRNRTLMMLLLAIGAVILAFVVALSVAVLTRGLKEEAGPQREIATARSGNVVVRLSNAEGRITAGKNEFQLAFLDAATSEPLQAQNVSVEFFMPAMGTMPPMQSGADISPTTKPGRFRAVVDVPMSGEWRVTVRFDGPAGPQQVTFSVNAQ